MIGKTDSNSFLIRSYKEGDYDQIAILWEKTGMGNRKRGDNAHIIEKSIRLGGFLIILEEKESGKICGTSWLTFDGRRIYMHHFGILPAYQGNGLSKILLQKSLEFVKAKGCQVKLEVHESNTKAINLYKKSGFEYLGDYDVYIIRDISKI